MKAGAGGFHTITLGCKLNRFDTAALEGELARRGLAPADGLADASVVVVNTCTVTGKADAEARKLIRRVRRTNRSCRLLVTGCYAEIEAETLRAIDGVDAVFGNREKADVGRLLDGMGIGALDATGLPGGDRGCDGTPTLPDTLHFGDRARALLKVQEGCNLVCSYCIIPRARGRSRSVPPERIVSGLRAIVRSGYREVVLTGVNTGDYGKDLRPRTSLAALLERLLAAAGPTRIRLNSLEPLTVTEEIVDLLAGEPRLAPHLQVPLQSGSDRVLSRMRRNYRADAYLERLRRVRSRVPHAGLGADVIVGFPGEEDDDFEATYRLIESSPLNYLHVFPWSPRPGTPASEMEGRVRDAVVRERAARLRALASRSSRRFRSGFRGKRLDAVVLGSRNGDRRWRALTGNYIEVAIEGEGLARGDLVAVRVSEVAHGETVALLDGRPDWAPRACRPTVSS